MSSRKKKLPAAAELASRVGADEALTSLINQFSDPLSFLRELIQNSLDAASTRLDVEFSFEPASEDGQPGLMTISVTDNGAGMTERIIDDYLLTLFRSTKEDDLTKIGKFGVGFVSIFAMEPRLVVLETGQAGESWRILFHPDASFEKLRLDEPLEGTRVSLHSEVTREAFEDLRRRGIETVRYWCKYAEAELLVDGEEMGQPFALEANLVVRYQEPGTEALVGFAPPDGELSAGAETRPGQEVSLELSSLCGFYNRGLTLVEAPTPPGKRGAAALAGLSMRVKSRYLEHTLTRDNVRQDAQYEKVMALVRRQVEEALRPALVQYLERVAAEPGDDQPHGPGLALALLYARLPSMALHRTCSRARIFPTVEGEAVSFRRLRKQERVLFAPHANHVTRLLAAAGTPVVLEHHGLAAHLRVCGLKVAPVDLVYYTAVEVPQDEAATALLREVDHLVDSAWSRVDHLRLGDLDYPGSLVVRRLFVRQREPFGLTRAGEEDRPGLLGGARVVVLNVQHPLVRACLALSQTDSPLAAMLLAQALISTEGRVSERRALKMARVSLDRAGKAPPPAPQERP